MLLDEFLSLGRVEKLVHALAYVRGWGIRIATVIQSEAQLQAVYGRELAEFFIDNHRARVYYRPPVHRRDLAEQISKIVGQKTVKQTSYGYAEGRRSRQVSQTGQAILDTDEIAHLREDETVVLVEGVRPTIGRKLRYYRDPTFKTRRLAALPLPAPLAIPLPDAPRVASKTADADDEGQGGTVERADAGSPHERFRRARARGHRGDSRSPAVAPAPRTWNGWPRPWPGSSTRPTPRPWPRSPTPPNRPFE